MFKTLLEQEVEHSILLDGSGPAARQPLKERRLVGGYDLLYPKVRDFMREHLFDRPVDLNDPVVLRNLSEPKVAKREVTRGNGWAPCGAQQKISTRSARRTTEVHGEAIRTLRAGYARALRAAPGNRLRAAPWSQCSPC